GELVLAEPRGDDEGADIILERAFERRDEVGKREIRPALALRRLLAQPVKDSNRFLSGLVGKQHDVVAHAVRGPESDRRRRGEWALGNEASQHLLRVLIKAARGDAVFLVAENRRKLPRKLPGRKERRPIDVVDELGERIIGEQLRAEKARPRRRIAGPVEFRRVRPRRFERKALPILVLARVRGGDL